MTTTAIAPKAQTGYWIARCSVGHAVRYTDTERAAAIAPWSSSKHGATVCHCNATAKFAPIRVRVTETECGPRCTSALGPSCDCKCGGENHSSDHRGH